jgi:hypothetical protein
MTRLRMGKSVHRWEVVIPAFVRLRIFTPFCFVYDTSAVRRPTLTIGVSLERKITRLSYLIKWVSLGTPVSSRGARCVRKKNNKKNYIIIQGGELTCFHFFKSSCYLNGWKDLVSQNDSFTHGKVCTQMGSGQPNVCTTSDFHAVLFCVWYLSSSEAYTNNWGLFKIERVLTGFLIGWNRLLRSQGVIPHPLPEVNFIMVEIPTSKPYIFMIRVIWTKFG